MYNRYIPQPDGSFHCNRLPDSTAPAQPQPRPPRPPAPPHSDQPSKADPPPKTDPPPRTDPPSHRPAPSNPGGASIGSFLRQILPKGLDTSDLFVILLLLLMAGDDPEDRNNALLTLVLYLFL